MIASKYDAFWISVIDKIHQKILDAESSNQVVSLDISAITQYGSRKSWYGNVEILNCDISDGKMAHARSLGEIFINKCMSRYLSHVKIKFTITANLQLKIAMIKDSPYDRRSNEVYDDPIESIYHILDRLPFYDYSYIANNLPINGIYFFFERNESVNLNGIVKDRIVRVGTHNADGRFKNRIRTHYKSNKNSSVFRKHIGAALIKRMNIQGISINEWMKQMTPTNNYVEELIDETFKASFRFCCIPVETEKQRLYFEKKLIAELARSKQAPSHDWLGQSAFKREIKNTGLWNVNYVKNPSTLNKQDLSHLGRLVETLSVDDIKVTKSSKKDCAKVKKENSDIKKFRHFSSAPTLSSSNGKVVCFIQCCKRKSATGKIIKPEVSISSNDIPWTFNSLMQGRRMMHNKIYYDSPATSAINIYTGSLYNVIQPYLEAIVKMIQSGRIRLIIISAGYGVIDALEPIHNYDVKMIKGKTGSANVWKDVDLAEIISDLLLKEQASRVYGFFPGEPKWSTSGSKYRYFFTEGLKAALKRGLEPESCGCFYRHFGRGVPAILGSLGRTFVELIKRDFNDSYVKYIYQHNRRDGKVIIGFDPIK